MSVLRLGVVVLLLAVAGSAQAVTYWMATPGLDSSFHNVVYEFAEDQPGSVMLESWNKTHFDRPGMVPAAYPRTHVPTPYHWTAKDHNGLGNPTDPGVRHAAHGPGVHRDALRANASDHMRMGAVTGYPAEESFYRPWHERPGYSHPAAYEAVAGHNLDTSYMLTGMFAEFGPQSGQASIVATMPDTTVTVTASTDLLYGDEAVVTSGESVEFVLEPFDEWTIRAINGSLAGTTIEADQPVAVWELNDRIVLGPSAHTNSTVAGAVPGRSMLGTEYVACSSFQQDHEYRLSITATEPDTQVVIKDPSEHAKLLNQGETWETTVAGDAYIQASAPIVAFHSYGMVDDWESRWEGHFLLPPAEWTPSPRIADPSNKPFGGWSDLTWVVAHPTSVDIFSPSIADDPTGEHPTKRVHALSGTPFACTAYHQPHAGIPGTLRIESGDTPTYLTAITVEPSPLGWSAWPPCLDEDPWESLGLEAAVSDKVALSWHVQEQPCDEALFEVRVRTSTGFDSVLAEVSGGEYVASLPGPCEVWTYTVQRIGGPNGSVTVDNDQPGCNPVKCPRFQQSAWSVELQHGTTNRFDVAVVDVEGTGYALEVDAPYGFEDGAVVIPPESEGGFVVRLTPMLEACPVVEQPWTVAWVDVPDTCPVLQRGPQSLSAGPAEVVVSAPGAVGLVVDGLGSQPFGNAWLLAWDATPGQVLVTASFEGPGGSCPDQVDAAWTIEVTSPPEACDSCIEEPCPVLVGDPTVIHGELGRRVAHRIRAQEPDLVYEAEPPYLPGLQLDPLTGDVQWWPQETGDHQASYRISQFDTQCIQQHTVTYHIPRHAACASIDGPRELAHQEVGERHANESALRMEAPIGWQAIDLLTGVAGSWQGDHDATATIHGPCTQILSIDLHGPPTTERKPTDTKAPPATPATETETLSPKAATNVLSETRAEENETIPWILVLFGVASAGIILAWRRRKKA